MAFIKTKTILQGRRSPIIFLVVICKFKPGVLFTCYLQFYFLWKLGKPLRSSGHFFNFKDTRASNVHPSVLKSQTFSASRYAFDLFASRLWIWNIPDLLTFTIGTHPFILFGWNSRTTLFDISELSRIALQDTRIDEVFNWICLSETWMSTRSVNKIRGFDSCGRF